MKLKSGNLRSRRKFNETDNANSELTWEATPEMKNIKTCMNFNDNR